MSYVLHIDMNSYFASVEQQANPRLRGKPVGVCAYLSGNGCIIASSLEAKKAGVKTGTRVREAKALCPRIILVENEPSKYRSTTERIFGILNEYTDRLEPYSIDEAFLDLTGWVHSFDEAAARGATIRHRITTEVGEWLRCSIGISWTRWLAKFGSDIADKDSTLCITPERLPELLKGRALTDAWGINYRLEARLNVLGIHTLDQLQTAPVPMLRKALGMYGYYLWADVNGVELGGVQPTDETKAKSIGHTYCVPRHTTDRTYVRSVLMKLCEKTGRRLRASGQEAWRVGAWLGFVEGGGVGGGRRMHEPLYTSASILQAAERLTLTVPLPDRVNFVAVNVSALRPVSGQQSLFADRLRPLRLSQALDRINDVFGEYTISPGMMWQARGQAVDRVGYRKSVDPLPFTEPVAYAVDVV